MTDDVWTLRLCPECERCDHPVRAAIRPPKLPTTTGDRA